MSTSRHPLRYFGLLPLLWGFSNAAAPAAGPQQPPAAPASEPAPRTRPSASTVWVNTTSGYYHKPDSRHYGKTKRGKYMSEPDALRAGYRPARN